MQATWDFEAHASDTSLNPSSIDMWGIRSLSRKVLRIAGKYEYAKRVLIVAKKTRTRTA